MRLVISILSILTFCFGEYLYILIDDVKLYTCKGVKNEIKVIDEDVSFLNEKGSKVYYIRAPGNYSLHFKKVTVERDFGFLAGEIGATLQVPLIQGPAGFHFDYPHTIVPETGLFYQHCDEHSGIVERNGRQYCRYCDLCGAGEHLESKLNDGGHQFFPLNPTDASKTPKCGALAANAYEFKKTISLPAKGALQDLFNEKMQGMDAEMRRKFGQGSGRFQMFLNLITTDKPSIPQDRWFERSKECKCCGRMADSCGSNSHLYCSDEEMCKTNWAMKCLHKSARVAACYSVEFNYNMTTSYSDVLAFLRRNNYPTDDDVEERTRPSEADPVDREPAAEDTQIPGPSLAELCVAAMPRSRSHMQRYCSSFWNSRLCCPHCGSIC